MASKAFEVNSWAFCDALEKAECKVDDIVVAATEYAMADYVFDLWAERWRRRKATGDMIMVRYADDIVVGFQHESDARRFWEAMRDRLKEFSLSLHPDKTRLMEFGRFAAQNCKKRGLAKPETFTFLGFVLICDKSRRGDFRVRSASESDPKLRRRLLNLIDEMLRMELYGVDAILKAHER